MSVVKKFNCQICGKVSRECYLGILRHIRSVHSFEPNFHILCGLDNGCPATYSVFESFRSHVYKKHRESLLSSDTNDNSGSSHQEGVAVALVDTGTDNGHDKIEEFENDSDEENPTVDNAKMAAMFILRTTEIQRTSQTAMNGIIDGIKVILSTTLTKVQSDLIATLDSTGMSLNTSQKELVEKVISNAVDPFKDIGTRYLQDKYIQENLQYLGPTECVLDRYYQQNSRGQSKEVTDCFYYVPLLESLQRMLDCKAICNNVFKNNQSTDGMLRSYCDGTGFKNHTLFQRDPFALQLHLFYDDLEVSNPLGSKASIHKLGVFYYSIGNLPPSLRSCLHSIQLVAIVKTRFIEKYGVDKILEPFVHDLKELEKDNGVELKIDGQTRQCHGTLVNVSADNPAACLIGGFKQLHSALRKCRHCLAVDDDIQRKFKESDYRLRTRELHKTHLEDLTGDLRDHFATINGVNRSSILNESRYFHVVDGISPDIMHDLLEGVLQFSIMLLLKQFIVHKKYFHIKTLNNRITSFCYGPIESANKPSTFKENGFSSASDTGMKQTASQTWCLARYLPLLIGDLVPEKDANWEHYLHLMEMVDYILAPVTTMANIEYLRILIEDYLVEFRMLYPDSHLTPKCHYLIHVPSWMSKCGPLTTLWCMRYEAKHRHLKEMTAVVRNFKNIPQSLAYHHQRSMCYRMADKDGYLLQKEEHGTAVKTTVSSLDYGDTLTANYEVNNESTVYRFKYAIIKGTKYTIGYVVLCYFDDDKAPIFGKLKDIICLVNDHRTLFILDPLIPSRFNSHFYAYQVLLQEDQTLVYTQEELADYHPLYVSKSFHVSSPMFVRMKYHVE